jgi:HIRAN domain
VATEIRLSFNDERVRVAGVSHYQEDLLALVGEADTGRVRHETSATLEPEPDNPHDPEAVKVLLEGRHVGYLSRDDARRYGPAVRLLLEHGRVLACDAVVGGRGPDATTDNLGVFLELPRAPEALLEARTVTGG